MCKPFGLALMLNSVECLECTDTYQNLLLREDVPYGFAPERRRPVLSAGKPLVCCSRVSRSGKHIIGESDFCL